MISKRFLLFIVPLLIIATTGIASNGALQVAGAAKSITAIDTTMWKYLSASDRSQWTISKEDSEKAYRTYFVNGAKAFRDFTILSQKIETKRATIQDIADDLIKCLSQARGEFEKGIKLDPFNNYLRTAITAVYLNLDPLLAYKNDNPNRLQILFNKIYLETDPLKKADLYNKIGKIYFNYKSWEKARDNFQLAVANIFEGEVTDIDTAKLFDNIYYRGYSHLKLYEDEPALTSFENASMIAPTEDQKKDLARWIDYINWDKGNIHASEQYQNAKAFYAEKKYDDAERAYLDLIQIVQTEHARDEIAYRLSMVQFNNLDKKPEAIQRLWNVVKTFSLDETTGVPNEPTQAEYWESYCKMCLNLAANSFYEDKKTAFIYFQKASQIESSIRGNAFLNLAIMSLNNPELCLNFCDRSFSYIDRLNESDKKMLYNTYYRAYQQKGNFDEAMKWFKKFNEI
jgi:tetratricopeptide (TPR) repeat protein